MSIGEKVPDVEQGAPDAELHPETGLSPEDHAAWEAMQRDEAPAGDAPAGDADAGAGDGDGGDADADAGDGDGEGDGADASADGGDGADKDQAAADAGDGEGTRKPKTINYNKHQRETKKLQDRIAATERDRQALAERFARLDERTKVLLEALNGAGKPKKEAEPDPAEQDPEPDQNDDPLGHAAWTRRELGRTQERLANIEKGITTERQQRQTESREQTLERSYVQDVEAVAQADPTFTPAYEFLRESRYRELGFTHAGIDINNADEVKTLSEEDQIKLRDAIVDTFNREQLWVAEQAFARKQSPAKAIYNLARARGFDPAKVTKPAAETQPGKETVPAARPGGPKPPATRPAPRSAAAELADIRAGVEASKSLSDAGGANGDGLTVEKLIAMDDDQFAELYATLPKGQLDKLMGK